MSILLAIGGKVGYDKVLWEVSSKLDIDGSPSATFKYRSFDGEQGTNILTTCIKVYDHVWNVCLVS